MEQSWESLLWQTQVWWSRRRAATGRDRRHKILKLERKVEEEEASERQPDKLAATKQEVKPFRDRKWISKEKVELQNKTGSDGCVSGRSLVWVGL